MAKTKPDTTNKTRLPEVTHRRRNRPPKDAFAFVLSAARRSLGITQTEVAARSKVAPSVIARIESGRSAIGEETIRRYAKVLGMRVVFRLVRIRRRSKR